MALPLIRLQPFYPGQMGVDGSDTPRGLRSQSAGIVLFVDNGHPNANAVNDGTDPENPVSTIAAAMARLVVWHALSSTPAEGSVIVISPGVYTDNITIANATYPEDCTILGAANGKHAVIWRPATGDALVIDQGGWMVDGIHFQSSATGAGVKLTRDAGEGGEDATIQNCFFDGRWGTGQSGIEFEGCPANVTIQNCRFAEFDASSPCITITNTGTALPYQTHIFGCTFQECAEYIHSGIYGWNVSIIAGNFFVSAGGALAATTEYIDLGAGGQGYNQVVGNYFSGDYSNTGGYTAHANALDNWVGNFAQDVAEAEVGDNGITIAEPAA